jgi:uncharacterized caspase-like protein
VGGAARLPALHLLAVGIDKYRVGIPPLKCAANDATQLVDAFKKIGSDKDPLFREVHTHSLKNAEATSGAVLAELAATQKAAGRDDIVVVFFAGHGTLSRGDFYFLTADSDPDAAKLNDGNSLSGRRLSRALGGMGCRVLLLLDACHSGAANLKPASDDAARGLSDDEVGVMVLSAAQGKQRAIETNGNGLFTLALKEALGDASDAPRARDGRMFTHHLYAHVSDRVRDLSDNRQTPFLRLPDDVPPFALRKFGKK